MWLRADTAAGAALPKIRPWSKAAAQRAGLRLRLRHPLESIAPAPAALPALEGITPGPIPTAEQLGLAADPCPQRQRGGRREGVALLESFLGERGSRYHRELSSPLTAFDSCSRLSPHPARRFVDYEPGIHWCQVQMQSGTTGINTIRAAADKATNATPQGGQTRDLSNGCRVFVTLCNGNG